MFKRKSASYFFFFYKMFYDIIKEDAFWKNMEP